MQKVAKLNASSLSLKYLVKLLPFKLHYAFIFALIYILDFNTFESEAHPEPTSTGYSEYLIIKYINI